MTYALSANIIHAITGIGYAGDSTRCGVLLSKDRERVRTEIVQRELLFERGDMCKQCFKYLEKK